MIVSFGDSTTEDLYHGRQTNRAHHIPQTIVPAALRKLDMINAASELKDLRMPPGNHLEALKGELQGYHSIRINDQWRVIFIWTNGNASKVSINDYH